MNMKEAKSISISVNGSIILSERLLHNKAHTSLSKRILYTEKAICITIIHILAHNIHIFNFFCSSSVFSQKMSFITNIIPIKSTRANTITLKSRAILRSKFFIHFSPVVPT